MSYPTPPGSGNPYGQPPPQSGWQPQPPPHGQAPVPPMPAAPPGEAPGVVPVQPGPPQYGQYAAYHPASSPVIPAPMPPSAASGGGGTARKVFGSLMSVFGLLGVLGGGALAAHAWSNHQLPIPNGAYGPVLWRNETTESLFPSTIGNPSDYNAEASDKDAAEWNRMGVSEDTSCSAGLSGETKATAKKLGCKAVLRATYVDLTGEMVATVAIIVLPQSGNSAQDMGEFLDDQQSEDVPDAAVVPLTVKSTLAAKWQANRRNGMGGTGLGGDLPYAVAVTTGAVDGRTSSNLPGDFGKYGGNDTDRQPWMDAAKALSETFKAHLTYLER